MSFWRLYGWLASISLLSSLCLALYTYSRPICPCAAGSSVEARVRTGGRTLVDESDTPTFRRDEAFRVKVFELVPLKPGEGWADSKGLVATRHGEAPRASKGRVAKSLQKDLLPPRPLAAAKGLVATPQGAPQRPLADGDVRWTTIATLGVVLERVAVDRTVIICTINTGYWEFFLNFLISLDRLGLADRALVFAGDVGSWRFVEDHWPGHAVLFRFSGRDNHLKEREGAHFFGNAGYGKMVGMRPAQILVCLEHGYSVLYSDVDAVFVRNPLPHFDGDFQVALAWDGHVKLPWMNGSDELPPAPAKLDLCTALIFARSSQQSMEIMQRWIVRIRQSKQQKNQPSFNAVLSEIRSENDTFFKFRILPSKSFPSGFTMKDKFDNEKWRSNGGGGGADIAVVHLNFYFGNAEKIQGFKHHNLWFLNGSSNGSSVVEWPRELAHKKRALGSAVESS